MTKLLQLLKAVRSRAGHSETADHGARLVRLADVDPNEEGAQVIAAYTAWVSGDDETAHRLAVRAQRPGGTAFPALLVLVATSAKGADESQTYAYAKQLTAATRNDKTANSVMKVFAGTGLLGPGSRRERLEYLDATDQTHDEWVAWAMEFVDAYEARSRES